MFKEFAQIGTLLKQAQQMQGKMAELQEQLKKVRVRGEAGGGMVSVEMNGQQQVLSCHIDASLLRSGDTEVLEDLIVAATNAAIENVKQAAAQAMGKMTEGVDMGAMSDMMSRLGLMK